MDKDRAVATETNTTGTSKADDIIRVGQELIQTQGYDGFSYRDVADRVGIRSASIHYYFPAKADLALAIAQKYRSDFAATVGELAGQGLDPVERLVGFAGIFQVTLEDLRRVCLCGMLASEANSLRQDVRKESERFFNDQQEWLAVTIAEGIAAGQVGNAIQPDAFARMFLSALEGAMIMALSMERPEHLADVATQLIELLSSDDRSGH